MDIKAEAIVMFNYKEFISEGPLNPEIPRLVVYSDGSVIEQKLSRDGSPQLTLSKLPSSQLKDLKDKIHKSKEVFAIRDYHNVAPCYFDSAITLLYVSDGVESALLVVEGATMVNDQLLPLACPEGSKVIPKVFLDLFNALMALPSGPESDWFPRRATVVLESWDLDFIPHDKIVEWSDSFPPVKQSDCDDSMTRCELEIEFQSSDMFEWFERASFEVHPVRVFNRLWVMEISADIPSHHQWERLR